MNKEKKPTVGDIYEDLDRKKLEISGSGYENIGSGMLLTFVILIIIFIAAIFFK